MLTVCDKTGRHTCYQTIEVNGKTKRLMTDGPTRVAAIIDMIDLMVDAGSEMNIEQFEKLVDEVGVA